MSPVTMGNCTKCKKEINSDQTFLKTTESHWEKKDCLQVEETVELLCNTCYAQKLTDELNEIRSSSFFPNYSPWAFKRMEWIRKKVNSLGYELT